MQDLEVEVWAMEKRLDHQAYGANPDYYINELKLSQLIEVNKTFENHLYIAKNTFDNLDHWFPWAKRHNGDFY